MSTAVLGTTRTTSTAQSTLEAFERVACLGCGHDDPQFFLVGEDDLGGTPGQFTYARCRRCALVYQTPRLTLDAIRPYYEHDYIAHQSGQRWGRFAPLFTAAVRSLDRRKLALVRRHTVLDARSRLLDVGCGSGSFLQMVRRDTGAAASGVDLIDLSSRPEMHDVEFFPGPFYEQPVGRASFDVVTMWHFLEHDYDPNRSLRHAWDALKPGGCLVVEVPRLDSVSARLFGRRWPGVQAPQHTVLFDRETLLRLVADCGFEVVEHLSRGAFPPYFYLFCGTAFCLLRGRGLNLDRAIGIYFAGQILLFPFLPLLERSNFAMQTVICRRPT